VREDFDTVKRLCDELKAAGIEVWLDKEDMRSQGGARWKNVIEAAIRDGDYFIACFSDAYWEKIKKKPFINTEIRWALDLLDEMLPEARYLLPVRLCDCDVPAYPIGRRDETPHDLHRIDLFPDWDDGIQQLIACILPGGPIPLEVQAELLRLRSPDPKLRRAGAYALGKIGSEAAIPALEKALVHRDDGVRFAAAKALAYIHAKHSPHK
jgi:hypothetical protein